VIICQGRSEFIEKYQEVTGELHDREFDVIACDWRGHGLSDRVAADPRKGHVDRFEDYDADLAEICVLAERQAYPKPWLMLAHSMGAMPGLRCLHDRPGLFERAVMTGAMFRLSFGAVAHRAIDGLATAFCLGGRGAAYAFSQDGRPYADREFEGNILTSSKERFETYRSLVRSDPALGLGGPTFGWVRAAIAGTRPFLRPDYLRTITTPVLLVGGALDSVVSNRAIERVGELLPNGQVLMIPQARHEVLIENDRIRAVFWAAFDRFVSGGHAPPGPAA
jgi:lysophospholipase